jgi:hypothetical protein
LHQREQQGEAGMTRATVLAMALALATGAATADDKARPRDGSNWKET